MLKISNSALVIIDVQGKLASLIENRELLFDNISRMIQGMKLLDIPMIITEQRPEKLGPTVPELANLITGIAPITKVSFSCCGNTTFIETLNALNRKQILVAGIETHVCVYQTVVDLIQFDFEVYVIADAVSARANINHLYGLDRMKSEGAILSTAELALFECIRTSSDERFREMIKIVK